jgi:hypothetical protein
MKEKASTVSLNGSTEKFNRTACYLKHAVEGTIRNQSPGAPVKQLPEDARQLGLPEDSNNIFKVKLSGNNPKTKAYR